MIKQCIICEREFEGNANQRYCAECHQYVQSHYRQLKNAQKNKR